jgi:hypothetical protein
VLPWEIEMVLEEPEDDEWWAAAVFPGGFGGDGECVRVRVPVRLLVCWLLCALCSQLSAPKGLCGVGVG